MKKSIVSLVIGLTTIIGYSQTDSDKKNKESASVEQNLADSLKVTKKSKRDEMVAKFMEIATYPVLDAGGFSGVVPVDDLTEIPDPSLDYKLMFELVKNKNDSISGLNEDLVEVARVINLHVASGIPMEKIFPVIVVHGPALNAFTTNEFYNDKFKKDNPNLKLINDLEALGAKFVACAQALYFFDIDKEELLPNFKISLTAQTILSSYQLKGYVKYW